MDLFRVQGRWAAAARLAWLRCVLVSETEVCDNSALTKLAPHSFPEFSLWENWVSLNNDYINL